MGSSLSKLHLRPTDGRGPSWPTRRGTERPSGPSVPLGLTSMLEGFVERIKQYEAKEQAELRVRVMVPGSWFNNLTDAERREKYQAEAYDWVAAHRFPKKGAKPAQTCAAIKFLCEADVFEGPKHAGFIIPIRSTGIATATTHTRTTRAPRSRTSVTWRRTFPTLRPASLPRMPRESGRPSTPSSRS